MAAETNWSKRMMFSWLQSLLQKYLQWQLNNAKATFPQVKSEMSQKVLHRLLYLDLQQNELINVML